MSKDAVTTATAASRTDAAPKPADAGDAGYSKARHVNMIAIGGAIGTGLFLGAGGRLHSAGPALALAYLVCGVFAKAGLLTRPAFRLPGSPVRETVTIAFLVAVLGLMWNDPEVGRKTLLLVAVIAAMLVAGWFGVRGRVGRRTDRQQAGR